MAYQGRRDPEIRIVVPHNQCKRYQSKTSGVWVEIFTPPENVNDYATQWGSIMVRPEQVCNIGDGFNIVRINDGAQVNNSIKDANHAVISTEIITPEIIIGRWLKFYRYDLFSKVGVQNDILDIPSNRLYNDMLTIGQSMPFYMNRMPLHV